MPGRQRRRQRQRHRGAAPGCTAGDAQWWTLRADGALRAPGTCPDVTGFGTADGTEVELWDCTGGANQRWQPYNGGHRNPLSGRCPDDPGFATADGTRLALWTCNAGVNPRWTTLPTVA
ncbi:ricin-type beta-trefoil lectin domain protein [Kitasatospora sp. NPDC090308]|uniref:ricin-type beta-trefoil lectin domain protein n=1 Tax=Kitasatospora sp. NPDC090308 TaxID=3364082 RepID=UPI00381D97D4